MQSRDAIKAAFGLVVLSADRWAKMLVRRQARALEIVAGMAVADFLTTDLQRRICKDGPYGKFWQSNGCTSVGAD